MRRRPPISTRTDTLCPYTPSCRSGSGMVHRRLALARVEDGHDLATPGDRPDRQAAADDLAEGGDVGLEPELGGGAAIAHAKVEDLVCDQHDSVPPGEGEIGRAHV